VTRGRPAVSPRASQRGESAGEGPALVVGAQRAPQLEHAAAELAGDGADDGAAPVVLRTAHDHGPGVARAQERWNGCDRPAQRLGHHELVRRRQLVRRGEAQPRGRRAPHLAAQRVPHGGRALENPLQARRLGVDPLDQAAVEQGAHAVADVRDSVVVAPPGGEEAERRPVLARRDGLRAFDHEAEARIFLDQTDGEEQRHRAVVEAERFAEGAQRKMDADALLPASDGADPLFRRLGRRGFPAAEALDLIEVVAEEGELLQGLVQ